MAAVAASVPASINSLAELAVAGGASVKELLELDEMELPDRMAVMVDTKAKSQTPFSPLKFCFPVNHFRSCL